MGEYRQQQIFKIRRDYNSWVANETLEDYALRFAPRSFRKWSEFRVANTAFGSISFLVLEAIGGALTLTYGFTNAFWAIVSVGLVIFLTGFPLAYYAARHNIDMDLLTRGAGFGYIGSTLTSLIYASFTFTLFALEASIMSLALQMYFGWPIEFCHLVSAVVIIPLVMYGITNINRLQLWTQPVWLILLIVPFAAIFLHERDAIPALLAYAGASGEHTGFSWLAFGAASTVAFALIAQIGEQIDFLRFMPEKTRENRLRWWSAVIVAGPGWIVFGVVRQLMGAFLAYLAIRAGVSASHAFEPTQMYLMAYGHVFDDASLAIAATVLLVVISQVKINVTNAYAGSLAWSNFFSRLTHSHPGRVVWLVFNVAIALLLMELGVFGALERVLGLFSNIAIAWIGALVADLVVNKPLKLSPPFVEFKRAYLPDINPVGVFSTLIASGLSIAAYLGLFGVALQAFSAYLALCVAFVSAPLIAWFTRGRAYIVRSPDLRREAGANDPCCICGNTFEAEDNAFCPAYGGTICSLCCTLDARCRDACKPGYRLDDQLQRLADWCLPRRLTAPLRLRLLQFTLLFLLLSAMTGIFVGVIYYQDLLALADGDAASATLLANNFVKVYACLLIFIGLASWWLILNNESRQVAQEESKRQTTLLLKEIADHRNTDAELQRAREAADNANRAKSRFLTDMSHEVRTPLNSILGYAQLLRKDPSIPQHRRDAVATIQNSGEHLARLIDDILDIARIEARRFEMKREPIDVPALVEQMVKMFKPQAEAKGLAFRCQMRNRLPHHVRGDENRLRQILINLLSNAIKFTSVGEVILQVDYGGQVIVFRVSDTGEGIPADQLDEIFQPFRRLNINRGNAVSGSGLGLTICKILAEVMGGELKVESAGGSGTTFTLRLFTPELHDVQPGRQTAISSIEAEEREIAGYAGPRRKILIVDDQQQHRELLRSVLAPLGFELVEAGTGDDGCALALAQRPQLILTDLDMGADSGNDLVRRLRAAGSSASMIVISAHAYQNHRADAIAAGADDFIAKPFQIDDLLGKIRLHLNLEWVHAGEAPQPMPPVGDSAPIRFPDSDTLRELAQLARIGDLRGLTGQLQQLADRQPDYTAFATHLQGLAKAFRLADIKRLLSEE
jgi:signal transduction histidine kinase/CheY-like chemotaxis protein/purine-cytosine permease-like protein